MNRMYKENAKSLNAYVGCKHGCIYCVSSFQRQAKRQKKRCMDCYTYTPHFHPERLLKAPPKTVGKDFVFFPSSADLAFATKSEVQAHIDYARKYLETTFLTQSKAPAFFMNYSFPSNMILATTLETNKTNFLNNPSSYDAYRRISCAPEPFKRAISMAFLNHNRKAVTIEPILSFSLPIMTAYIKTIEPEFVYVGYDNHNCKLPEPRLSKTLKLIERLEKFTEVRCKTLRKAWWEKEESSV